jgi:hypothetical protein
VLDAHETFFVVIAFYHNSPSICRKGGRRVCRSAHARTGLGIVPPTRNAGRLISDRPSASRSRPRSSRYSYGHGVASR